MALVLKDRVKETTTTTGTGTITLAGAVAGYQAFSVIGNTNTTYYCIAYGSDWEVGIGTYTLSGTTLARTTILSSSNAGAAVNFSVGSKDVFVVYPAGEAVYGVIDNTFFNTAVGFDALAANTTAKWNTALGYQALRSNATSTISSRAGESNIAVGYLALYSNTFGCRNTGFGYRVLHANVLGCDNIAIGENAASSFTECYDNIAIGTNTLGGGLGGPGGGTDIYYNIAIGTNSLGDNNTGDYNTAVGAETLNRNTTGDNNTVIGVYGLYLNTTGINNAVVGCDALSMNTTGVNNAVVGFQSGRVITTGSKNSIFGGYTGNQGGLDIRTLSNRIVLSDGDGNPRWYIDNTGAAGYGPTTGGTVTQVTSRTTGVNLGKPTGAITLISEAGTATWQSFTVTNSTVAATDTVIVNQKSGTDLYMIHVTNVGAGSFQITFATTGGTTTEQPVFNFALIKGQTT